MRVSLLDLQRLHAPLREQLLSATARVLDSGRFVLGPEVEGLEREVAALCGRGHGVGTSSGSDALLLTLMALGIGPGDEVVTTPFSFFATTGAIARLGATPVFADIGDDDFNLDPEAALGRVGPRTRAILPVDLFGRRAEIGRLAAGLAGAGATQGMAIVEDAAQAIGAPGLGEGARAATLSFFPSKNLGALGDGGMVLTDDAELAERGRRMRQHGSHPKYVHATLGGNFRLDALQAALLRVKLPHLPEWTAARRRHARFYGAALAGLAAADGGLRLPADAPGHVFHHYVIRVDGGRRDGLRAALAEDGIDSEIYYPLPLHLQPCLAHLGGRPGQHPRAEAAAAEALALPIHPTMERAQLEHVVDRVDRHLRRGRA